jgi:colanic acid/amylovoran biosynthesis glycosyltransferase
MNPRLGYLISRYPAISHTFILREVQELRKLGFQIEVASINSVDRPAAQLAAEEREEAARTWYVKAQGAGGALSANLKTLFTRPAAWLRAAVFALKLGGTDIRRVVLCFFYLIEAAMVGQWMQRRGLRHLHVHFATPASSVGLILTKMFPVTFSITVHGPDEFYDVPGYQLEEKIAAARLLCTIGFYARSQLMRLSSAEHWDKIRITPLGVDPELFRPAPFRADYDTFEVICVGRLVAAKGQRVLIDAVAALAAQGRKIRLRLVGDGPDRASLEEAVRKRGAGATIVFEGAVNQDRIRDLYRQAHAFALASFAEGIPVVLMEAMAMEIPCVTTWITGIPELIRDGIDGLLAAPSDQAGLAAALARLMDDAELRKRIGAAGRARVVEKYHLRKNVELLAGVFRETLADAA